MSNSGENNPFAVGLGKIPVPFTTDLANDAWIQANTWTCDQCLKTVPPLFLDLPVIGQRLVRRMACPTPGCIPPWEREEQQKAAVKGMQEKLHRVTLFYRDFPPDAMGDRLLGARWEDWKGDRPGVATATARAVDFATALSGRKLLDPPGLLFHGVPGNGKSTLAALIYHAARQETLAAAWIHVPSWLETMGALAKTDNAEAQRLIAAACDADLLVMDDLGTQNLTGPRMGWILRLVDARYRDRRPLVVTMNPSPGDLFKILQRAAQKAAKVAFDQGEDDDGGLAEMEAGRIVDRLSEACRFVQIKADSYRLVKALERQRKGE